MLTTLVDHFKCIFVFCSFLGGGRAGVSWKMIRILFYLDLHYSFRYGQVCTKILEFGPFSVGICPWFKICELQLHRLLSLQVLLSGQK